MKNVLIIIAVLALIVVVGVASNNTTAQPQQPTKFSNAQAEPTRQATPTLPPEMVAEGQLVCVPSKDSNDPLTGGCAYGLKKADGTYLGLDFINGTTYNPSK